jgi:hypothetical protein
MKAGDLIQTKHKLIGEIVAVDDDSIEVYFLVPDQSKANGKVWVYKSEWDTIYKTDVAVHVEVKDRKKYPQYYRQLGFKAWDGEIFTRTDVDIETDEDLKAYPFPTGCDTDTECDDYMFDGFVIPDNEDDAFTFADPVNKEVQEFHQAVNDYNNWNPTDPSEQRAKSFVDALERKFSTKDDNFQFKRGTSVDYKRPPVLKSEKNK